MADDTVVVSVETQGAHALTGHDHAHPAGRSCLGLLLRSLGQPCLEREDDGSPVTNELRSCIRSTVLPSNHARSASMSAQSKTSNRTLHSLQEAHRFRVNIYCRSVHAFVGSKHTYRNHWQSRAHCAFNALAGLYVAPSRSY